MKIARRRRRGAENFDRWVERFRCQVHGAVSTETCVICAAERALSKKLARDRHKREVKKERTISSETNHERIG